ncbi:hypothetical protein BAU15_09965 [Enterococcus sp. JM4C]|uniref:hypothetical protein n=1 Tax=Candidatus Enterococcus huntleyi TaxID=1857217 RepID=UPI00137A3C6F|nr:hypothetical protein [Enterococcus sp. JM4C]KAF1298161.1 hypothetical protein BAU15_09965 [Enterococcus sp. JM4C]
MTLIITAGFIIALGLLFLIIARQFQRGRWLRLIAGNTFGEIPKDKLQKVSKQSSHWMYFASLFSILIALSLLTENRKILYFCLILTIIIGAIGISYSLVTWLKNG